MKGEDELLTAQLKDGKIISLVDGYSKVRLEDLRRRESFYCRTCSERVILKLGTKRIFHFAHEVGSSCMEDYERESEYHMSGKVHLYDWLLSQQLSPKLEHYFPAIKQRADLVFSYEDRMYAIEFQCSIIDETLFKKRTTGYRRISVTPLWILGGKNIQRLGPRKASLSNFSYLFLRECGDSLYYLPTYCPQAQKFILLENIIPISVRNAHCSYSLSSPGNIKIEELLKPNTPFMIDWHQWRADMARGRVQVVTKVTSVQDPFIQELYTQSLNPVLIPPYVGIPLKNNVAIETAPFIWQTYFFMDHLLPSRLGSEFRFQDIYVQFLRRVHSGQIKLRNLPSVSKNLFPFAIREYLSFLTDMGMLRKGRHDHYIMNQSIDLAMNMEEWHQQEENFFRKRKYLEDSAY